MYFPYSPLQLRPSILAQSQEYTTLYTIFPK